MKKQKEGKKKFFQNLEMVTYFRGYSLFLRFFILVLAMAIALMLIFTVYIQRVIESDSRDQYRLMNEQILARNQNQIDNSVFFLEEILLVAGNNKYVVDAAVRPGTEYNERNQDVVTYLKEITQSTQFFDQIWLYESVKDTVLASNGMAVSLENYLEKEDAGGHFDQILSSLENGKGVQILQSSGKYQLQLLTVEGELYVIYEYLKAAGNGYLSRLIAKINTDELFESVFGEVSDLDYEFIIQDGSGNIIYSGTKEGDKEPESAQILQTSSYLGWTYSMWPQDYKGHGILYYVQKILPFLLIMTIATLIFALFVAERFYAPISDLTKEISEKSSNDLQSQPRKHQGNEINYLSRTYSEMLQDKEQTEELLQSVRPDLERQIFLSLLHGNEINEEVLSQQLKDIGSDFQVHANYQVMIIRFLKLTDQDYMTSYIRIRQIEQSILEVLPEENCTALYIAENEDGLIILQYPLECSMAKIKAMEAYLHAQIETLAKANGDEPLLTTGKVCRGILNMPLSYEEANESMRRQIYFSADNGNASDNQNQGAHADTAQEYFSSQINLLNNFMGKNDIAAAEKQLSMLLSDLKQNGNELSFQRYGYEQILDNLIEKSMQFRTDQKDPDLQNYQNIYQELQTFTDATKLKDFAEEVIYKQFDFIKSQAEKRQNRLIAEAKEFVKEHYEDGDLSTQMIAEHIGITPSYLSNLFTVFTGETLVTYINEYRISQAIDLLQDTTFSIKEIGYRTGFNTAQNFNRVFKRVTGTSPGKYREK